MNPILEAMKCYDLLRGSKEYKDVRAFIANHAAERRLLFVRRKDSREMAGCAVVWQITDPYDVQIDATTPPDYDPEGRYVYVPLIYIAPDLRNTWVLGELLDKVVHRFKAADRIAFRRTHAPKRYKRFGTRSKNRIHILRNLRDATERTRCGPGGEGDPPENSGRSRGLPQEESAPEGTPGGVPVRGDGGLEPDRGSDPVHSGSAHASEGGDST